MTKDLNMLEWMHGNCYRTSHYPYSEERAYEADRRGIAVITETPAVGIRHVTLGCIYSVKLEISGTSRTPIRRYMRKC